MPIGRQGHQPTPGHEPAADELRRDVGGLGCVARLGFRRGGR